MKLSVLVPTYRRHADLIHCLSALAVQKRPADEVILVVRDDDKETSSVIADWETRLSIIAVKVDVAGQVNALNTGLGALSGDIVAITDDDAAPRFDWLERIERHFIGNAKLGGVGGRDWLHDNGSLMDGSATLVGTIQWFGRAVGNHHLGIGSAREVDFLKGANMSYRVRSLDGVRFCKDLRGLGAQVCNDMAFSLAVKRNGWHLLYDPAVAVDHYPAPRHEGDQRAVFHPQAVEDTAFNQYLSFLQFAPPSWRRKMALLWQDAIGTKGQPGFVHAIAGVLSNDSHSIARWKCAKRGRAAARTVARQSEANATQSHSISNQEHSH